MVRVGRNANFRRGMKLVVKRPANGIEAEPWAYDALLPRRPGTLVSVSKEHSLQLATTAIAVAGCVSRST
jgi:hypothetical protein